MIEVSRPIVAFLKALTRVNPLEDEEISGLHGMVLDELPARISDLILTHVCLTVETVAAPATAGPVVPVVASASVVILCPAMRPAPRVVGSLVDE